MKIISTWIIEVGYCQTRSCYVDEVAVADTVGITDRVRDRALLIDIARRVKGASDFVASSSDIDVASLADAIGAVTN